MPLGAAAFVLAAGLTRYEAAGRSHLSLLPQAAAKRYIANDDRILAGANG